MTGCLHRLRHVRSTSSLPSVQCRQDSALDNGKRSREVAAC